MTDNKNIITVKNAEGDPDTIAEIVIQNKIDFEPKVSIIIPVYNVEEYLRECLDSVVNQTLKEIEIICIDDGSTDSSLEILKEYAQKDNRITVMKQENLHAGVARNAGLAVAKGEYLHFLDSDDWVEKEMLQNIVREIASCDADICVFKTDSYNNQTKEFKPMPWGFVEKYIPKKQPFSSMDIKDYIFNFCMSWPWNKLFKHSFVKENNTLFQALTRTNDLFFVFSALSLAKKIVTLNECLLHYRVGLTTNLQSNNTKTPLDWYHASLSLKEFLFKKNLWKHFERSFVNCVVGGSQYNYNSVKNLEIKQVLHEKIKGEITQKLSINTHIQDIRYFYNFDSSNNFYKEFIRSGKQPSVTIIVPIYNTSRYLRECLDSIINQTLKDIEIICVNDGSTDNSLSIIKEYAEKDIRIRYIDKPNAGYGHTMNCGLNVAQGEYIGIVEPDDFIKPDMYETLYNKAKELDLDIIKADYYQFEEKNCQYEYKQIQVFGDKTYYNKILNPNTDTKILYMFSINPAGIFKNSFLKKYNIKHNETPGAAYQDNGFWAQTMYLANKIYFIDQHFYCYRQDNPNQSIHKKNNLWTIPDEYKFIDNMFVNNNHINHLKSYYILRKYHAYMWHMKARLSKIYWDEYTHRFSKEFKAHKKHNEIDEKLFSQQDLNDLNLIINNTESYLKNYKGFLCSVIIPVYNTEKYLKKCLDSIINQTLKEIEIICVDDGSTDDSLNILKEYASKDTRIKIITQENQKQGTARNKGLDIATGEYILFVDSDDYLELNACEKIYETASQRNLDMVLFSGVNVDEVTNKKVDNPYWQYSYLPQNFNHHKFSFNECKNFVHRLPVSACLTMYRNEFIQKNNIRFPEKIYFEDNLFFIKSITKMNFAGIIFDKLYNRVLHSSSTTQNWEKNFSDYIKIVDMLLEYLKSEKIESSILQNYTVAYFKGLNWHYNQFSDKEKAKYQKEIDELMKKHQTITTKKVNPIKAYLLFPVYLIKTARMKKKIHKKVCRIIRGQLSRQFENTLLLTKPQIRDFALKNSPAPDYVKKNIKKIANDIYDKFHFRKKHRILGIKFYTKNKHKELSSLLTYSIKQNDLLKQNQIYLQKENDILKTKIEETKKELQKTIQSNKNDIVNLRNYLNQQTNIIQERLLSVTDYKKALEIWYRSKTGKVLNLDNPQTFNEKIQWLKLYDSTPLKTQLADKYLVRDWVKEKIGEEYLIPLLGVYDSFDEIDFDKLPNQFVIKCNHGSGYNIIVKDKSTLNIQDAKNKINSWMKEDFAFKNGYELHYHGIQPKIIIEEFIDPYISNHEIQAWIFNNEIKFISVETIKDAANLERSTFYLDGKETEFQVSPIYYKKLKSNISPHIFNKAIDIAKKLKFSIPYVRIDLIEYNGDIKFREFTFTPGSGLSQIYPSNYSKTLGDWLILPSKIYNISTKEYSKV